MSNKPQITQSINLIKISEIINNTPYKIKDDDEIELDILHFVYGKDIPIAIDANDIAKKLNIEVIETMDLMEEFSQSRMYFCDNKQKIVIEILKISPSFKKNYLICKNIGHLFLHFFKAKKTFFEETISIKNAYQEYRTLNNTHYKQNHISEFIYDRQAQQFAGKMLIPHGAVIELFSRLKDKERFVLSDICTVFNAPNDIMVQMLKVYKVWDFDKIYDNLHYESTTNSSSSNININIK